MFFNAHHSDPLLAMRVFKAVDFYCSTNVFFSFLSSNARALGDSLSEAIVRAWNRERGVGNGDFESREQELIL